MKQSLIARPLSLLLALVLSLSCLLPLLQVPASAASASQILNAIFDPAYYKAANPDVVRVYGSSASSLRSHYNDHGKAEGRRPSAVFDPAWYLGVYPDLKAAFGNDYAAALNHFLTCGIPEGRQGSAQFSVEIYKANYADLRAAFGTSSSDNWEYLQHYIQYGQKEGRNATSRISDSSGGSAATSTTMYVKVSNPANRLNLRSSPSTSASIVAKLTHGTAVQVLSTSNGWARVQVNGQTGYASTQYLSSAKPSGSSSGSTSSGGLVSPVPAGAKFSKKSSDNGWTGYHDINRGVSTSTPVYAVTGGTAYFYQCHTNGRLRSYGNYIRFVSADGTLEVRYAHLSRFNGVATPITADSAYPCSGAASKDLVGTLSVSAGQILGYVGTTGNSTGVHLHLEVYRNGSRVDPTTLFSGLI